MQVTVSVTVEDYIYLFYSRIAVEAGKTPAQAMSDALTWGAGQLLEAGMEQAHSQQTEAAPVIQ